MLRGLTLLQIEQLERQKTSDDRWRELTTPPDSALGYAAGLGGALLVANVAPQNWRIPALIGGGIAGNFAFNSLKDDAQETIDEIKDVGVSGQTAATGTVINAIEGGGKTPTAVDLAKTALAAADGVGMVESVKHRHDISWHPDYGAVMSDGKFHRGSVM